MLQHTSTLLPVCPRQHSYPDRTPNSPRLPALGKRETCSLTLDTRGAAPAKYDFIFPLRRSLLFILRPSSPMKLLESRPATLISAAPAEDPSAGEGPAMPETYGLDMVRAMLQDPFRIFIYWEVREKSLEALTRYFPPEDVEHFRVVLRLIEIEGKNEAFFEVGRRGRYWMMVFPGREYEFEIGVRSPVHGYIALVRSNRVRTPRGTVSSETAEEGDYRLSPPDFIEILETSGFAADQALNLSFAGMPGH